MAENGKKVTLVKVAKNDKNEQHSQKWLTMIKISRSCKNGSKF